MFDVDGLKIIINVTTIIYLLCAMYYLNHYISVVVNCLAAAMISSNFEIPEALP